MQDERRLPSQGRLRTASLSGITDSAAAGTAFAAGLKTFNARPGLDREDRPAQSLVELGRELGFRSGVVTTANVAHATPASFTAHHDNRADGFTIAAQQAAAPPHVLLGGGAFYFRSLVAPIEAQGYLYVNDAEGLAAARPADGRLLGIFAEDHLTYVHDRAPDSTEPTLAQMTAAALRVLDTGDEGFFLVVEGARIDMAGHINDLARHVEETLALDEAVRTALDWAEGRPEEVLILITADHETGDLRVVEPGEAGELPAVSWGRYRHTNQRVPIFGRGPHSELFAGAEHENTLVHAAIVAHMSGEPVRPPATPPLPDGRLEDLRHRPVEQGLESGFGEGHNRLDALYVDVANEASLAIGVEGLFESTDNAIVVLVDVDPGAGTGPARLVEAISDELGVADRILSQLNLAAPAVEGFGADFAVVSFATSDPELGELLDGGGLRGLRPPFGEASDLHWLPAALNFDEAVRVVDGPIEPTAARGFEVHIPLAELYPEGLPPGAAVTLAAVLFNGDGGFMANQALPPFPAGTANPGRVVTALPGLVHFVLDSDGDARADGDAPPTLLPR